ncbi:DUF3899 domain-containing protein [Marininema halotolerans]|uniref:DUF3899 domain-containing protein n=1 Tax=Marininema halotolerans TaxID=1155944 RepID=A0A1I6PT83_9BACL|nr:DUF3899 domain-containing protein [Marininema halotolerans]SFS43429.1 protein of unknown function [Marininema halotolerans]
MLNNRYLWGVFVSLLSILVTWLLSNGSTIRWINALFMTGLISMLIAATYFVVNGGFFNNFSRGFSKLFKIMSNNPMNDDFDDSPDGGDSGEERKAWASQMLITLTLTIGLVDLALSFILLTFR